MEPRNATVMIYDHGLFSSWAELLTRYFKRVLYYMPWKTAFSQTNHLMVGKGLPGVERVTDFFDHISDTDLFVFPDIQDGDLQDYLISQNKRVWGARHGDDLELYREPTKELMKKLDMPVIPWKTIIGLDALRLFLKDPLNENKYIKISTTRGDTETFCHETYQLTEPKLAELEFKLGPRKYTMPFIVEDKLDSDVEVGFDGFCVDGQYPVEDCLSGYEIKDCGYLGYVGPYSSLPKQVQFVNEKLSPVFRSYRYRGFWSSEIRIGKDGSSYLIDPCCRAGSPPSQLYQELYSNWGDILWYGAEGSVVQPQAVGRYGALAMIYSEWADANWQAVYYPEEVAQWVKLSFSCQLGIDRYAVPQHAGMSAIGAVVAVDDTILGAVKKLIRYADQISGYQIEIRTGSIAKAIREITIADQKFGIKFGKDRIPSVQELSALTAT